MSNLWRPWDAEEEESVHSENNQDKVKVSVDIVYKYCDKWTTGN